MPYVTACVLLIGIVAPAHAYIDAGSGSYMLQMALAGLMALGFTIKLSWQRLKTFATNLIQGHARPTNNLSTRGQA
jgi:hypothetical protein